MDLQISSAALRFITQRQYMAKKKYNTKRKSSKKISREDDASHRITFLLSASHLLHTTSPSLSRFYNGTVKQIGRRINLSLDAVSVKRLICKRCNTLTVPGNSLQRLASKRQSHVVITCGHCGAKRRYINRERAEQRPDIVQDASSGASPETVTPEGAPPAKKHKSIGEMCTLI